jgi:hypothetical protein
VIAPAKRLRIARRREVTEFSGTYQSGFFRLSGSCAELAGTQSTSPQRQETVS